MRMLDTQYAIDNFEKHSRFHDTQKIPWNTMPFSLFVISILIPLCAELNTFLRNLNFFEPKNYFMRLERVVGTESIPLKLEHKPKIYPYAQITDGTDAARLRFFGDKRSMPFERKFSSSFV